MLRVAICDDNKLFVEYMSQAVQAEFLNRKEKFLLKTYFSCESLYEHHLAKPFDVVFLDIDMPKHSGFQLASKISELKNCYIIFVTNHSDLVYDSLYFRPLNFITKSTDSCFTDKLHRVMNQLFHEIKQNKSVILENKEIGRISVQLKDILYIESSKHYVVFHSENNPPIKVRANFSEIEDYYSKYDFIRIHKCYIVNLRHIFNIDKKNDELIFKQGLKLNISKTYKQSVDRKLTQYLRRTL